MSCDGLHSAFWEQVLVIDQKLQMELFVRGQLWTTGRKNCWYDLYFPNLEAVVLWMLFPTPEWAEE